MALLDDLQAAQDKTLAAVNALGPQAVALNAEVVDLLVKVAAGGTVTQAMVDQAQSIATKTQALSDALAAIPGEASGTPKG